MNTTHLYKWTKASEKPLPVIKHRETLNILYKGRADLLCYYHGTWYWYAIDGDDRTKFQSNNVVHPDSLSAIEWAEPLPYPSTDDALQAEAEALYKGNVRMRQAHINAIQLERARKGTQERVREAMFDSWVAALERVDYLNNGNSRDCPPPPDKFEFINPYLERLFSLSQQSVSTETAEEILTCTCGEWYKKGSLCPNCYSPVADRIVRSLAEWSIKYPRGTVYPMSQKKMDDELIEIENKAKEYASSRSLKDGELKEHGIGFVNWVEANRMNVDFQEQHTHSIEELYKIFLNSLNK